MPSPRADQEAAVAKVGRGLASLVQTKGGTLHLRLTPDSLGEVRVELTVRDGVVSARMGAETDSARALLEAGVERLRAALESRGLRVERVQVESLHKGDEPGAEAHRRESGDGRRESGDGRGDREDRDDSGGGRPRWGAEHSFGDGDGRSRDGDGRDRDGRPEADRAGTDPGAVTAEGGPHEAEPWFDVGGSVRHGSARRLMVGLDTTV